MCGVRQKSGVRKEYLTALSYCINCKGAESRPVIWMEGIKGAISMVEKKWKSSWTMQNLASSDRLSANILLGLKLFLSLKTSLKTHV